MLNTLSTQNSLSLVTTRYMKGLEKYTENPIANSITIPKSLNYGGYKFQRIKFKYEFQDETKTIPKMESLLIT